MYSLEKDLVFMFFERVIRQEPIVTIIKDEKISEEFELLATSNEGNLLHLEGDEILLSFDVSDIKYRYDMVDEFITKNGEIIQVVF